MCLDITLASYIKWFLVCSSQSPHILTLFSVLPYFFATKSDPEAWKMQYAISLDCNSDGNAIYLFLAFFPLEKNTILKLFFCIFYTSMLVNNHSANLILRRIQMCIEEIVNQRAEMKKKWKNPNRLSKFFSSLQDQSVKFWLLFEAS